GVVAGIDLGGTNCTISVIVDGRPVTVPNSDGDPTTPSYVAFTSRGALIGRAAGRRRDPDRVIRLRPSAIGSPWTHQARGDARPPIARLKQDAEPCAGGRLAAATLTVPSDFTVEQMDLLRIAATGAGLPDVTFENSAVAAATAAGLLADDGPPVFVFDLGGTS